MLSHSNAYISYGVASVSRIDKLEGLFCKRAPKKRLYAAKETCSFIDPTNWSHPIYTYLFETPFRVWFHSRAYISHIFIYSRLLFVCYPFQYVYKLCTYPFQTPFRILSHSSGEISCILIYMCVLHS